MNCEANKLATDFNYEVPIDYYNVPTVPSIPPQLMIQEKTVTQNFKSTIQFNLVYKPLMQYITKQNDWTNYLVELVDWDLYHQLNKAYISHSVIKSKLLHNKLPTKEYLFIMK